MVKRCKQQHTMDRHHMVGDEGYIERQTEISAFVYCTITSLACRKGLRERMIQLYVNVVEGEMPFPCLACFFVMVVAEGVMVPNLHCPARRTHQFHPQC